GRGPELVHGVRDLGAGEPNLLTGAGADDSAGCPVETSLFHPIGASAAPPCSVVSLRFTAETTEKHRNHSGCSRSTSALGSASGVFVPGSPSSGTMPGGAGQAIRRIERRWQPR